MRSCEQNLSKEKTDKFGISTKKKKKNHLGSLLPSWNIKKMLTNVVIWPLQSKDQITVSSTNNRLLTSKTISHLQEKMHMLL